MAVYKSEKKSRKRFKFNKKAVGIAYLVASCLAFFFLFTNLLPFMQNFIFGTFGYFAYVFFVYLFLIGIAFINNRKYVVSKRYATFLVLTVI